MTTNVSQKTVLYAEDNSTYQRSISRMLGELGFKVTVVENGQLAVDAVNGKSDFTFILLDNQMPVMTGLEAAKEILKKKKDVTIILFTADELEKVKEKVHNLGIHYLQKPGSKQDFEKLIQTFGK